MMSALMLALLAQAAPASGAEADILDALRNRPKREAAPVPAALPRPSRLARCAALAESDPETALDDAQKLREGAQDSLELAHSAHCLGLALVQLGRLAEARTAFEMAGDEAPVTEPAYRARLAGLAGNVALAEGRADLALPLLAGAVETARPAAEPALSAGLMLDQARALVALSRLDEAASLLGAARAAHAADSQAWLLSATLARRQDRLAEAQGFIEQAALLAPADPAIGLEAGVIAALAGRDSAARASFASVIAAAPESEEAVQAQAYLAQLGQ